MLRRRPAAQVLGAAASEERQILGRNGDLAGTGTSTLGWAHRLPVWAGAAHLAGKIRGALEELFHPRIGQGKTLPDLT